MLLFIGPLESRWIFSHIVGASPVLYHFACALVVSGLRDHLSSFV